MLKYYYYSFVKNKGSGTVFRPLFFDFHHDQRVYNDEVTDTQFLIGDNIFAAPILEKEMTSREVYFPSQCSWYDIYTGTRFRNGTKASITNNSITDSIPIFIK